MSLTTSRRHALAAAAATLGAALLGGPALAQATYPSQPLKLIVPYPAGGATDTLARTLGAKLQEAWGQNVLVENRAGAGGNLGAEAVARAPADVVAKEREGLLALQQQLEAVQALILKLRSAK